MPSRSEGDDDSAHALLVRRIQVLEQHIQDRLQHEDYAAAAKLQEEMEALSTLKQQRHASAVTPPAQLAKGTKPPGACAANPSSTARPVASPARVASPGRSVIVQSFSQLFNPTAVQPSRLTLQGARLLSIGKKDRGGKGRGHASSSGKGTGVGKSKKAASEESQPVYCLLYTSPSPRDLSTSRMPSSA